MVDFKDILSINDALKYALHSTQCITEMQYSHDLIAEFLKTPFAQKIIHNSNRSLDSFIMQEIFNAGMIIGIRVERSRWQERAKKEGAQK